MPGPLPSLLTGGLDCLFQDWDVIALCWKKGNWQINLTWRPMLERVGKSFFVLFLTSHQQQRLISPSGGLIWQRKWFVTLWQMWKYHYSAVVQFLLFDVQLNLSSISLLISTSGHIQRYFFFISGQAWWGKSNHLHRRRSPFPPFQNFCLN